MTPYQLPYYQQTYRYQRLSDHKSRIACHCRSNFAGITIFVGCRWKLVDHQCQSLLFSQALDSAKFDESFDNRILTQENYEMISTNSTENSLTTEGTQADQNSSFTSLKAQFDDLKQQLELVKEQFQDDNTIQVIKG